AFTVLLPPADGEGDAPEETSDESAEPHDRPLILVVDDEYAAHSVASRALERAGYRTLVTENADQAREALEEHGNEIALILLDLTMPGLDGDEFLRAARPSAPVILSSGYSEAQAVGRCSDVPLAGFLHKPYRPSQLVEMVRGTLGQGA
ncbi:MAG: response regulator, partial [Armatimonadia bacterium]|nr:response regulator [Armatimonadia bacterium]